MSEEAYWRALQIYALRRIDELREKARKRKRRQTHDPMSEPYHSLGDER